MKLSDILTDKKDLEKFSKLEKYFTDIDETDLFDYSYQNKFIEYSEPHLKMLMNIFLDKYLSTYIRDYEIKLFASKMDEFYINQSFLGSGKLINPTTKFINIATIYKIALPPQPINYIDLSNNELYSTDLFNIYYFVDKLNKNKMIECCHLSLQNNNISKLTEQDITNIQKIFYSPHITYLDLRNNLLSDNDKKNISLSLSFYFTRLIWLNKSDIEDPNNSIDKVIVKTHLEFFSRN